MRLIYLSAEGCCLQIAIDVYSILPSDPGAPVSDYRKRQWSTSRLNAPNRANLPTEETPSNKMSFTVTSEPQKLQPGP